MNQHSLRGRQEERQAGGEGRQTGRNTGGVAGQGGGGKVKRDARTGEWAKVKKEM